jgi:DNA anti-recombination protein RmuC
MTKKNKIKKVIKGLQKASKSHAKQAKVLKSVLKKGKKRHGKD